jgi:hypothetical protein
MTTKQLPLFDIPKPIVPADPNVAPEAVPRLSRQARTILDLLREMPRSNVDLATVTARYGGRIYDLRKAGCRITTSHDPRSGLSLYNLTHEPEGLA